MADLSSLRPRRRLLRGGQLLGLAVVLVAIGGCGDTSGDARARQDLTRALHAIGPVTCATAANGDLVCRSRQANGGADDCAARHITHGPSAGQISGACSSSAAMMRFDARRIAAQLQRMAVLPGLGHVRSVRCARSSAGEWSCRVQTVHGTGRCAVTEEGHSYVTGVYCTRLT